MHPQCTPSGPKRTPVRGRISKKLDVMCPQCGQSFESYRYDVEQRKRTYCSLACQGKAHRMAIPPRDELVGLYEQGVSTNGLAFHYKVSKGTIYNWLKSYGVKTRTNGAGVTLAQTGTVHSAAWNAAIKAAWDSDGKRNAAALRMVERIHRAEIPTHSRSRGGKREDLGIYVRSTWESNYARFLTLLIQRGEIQRWDYEADTFEFHKVKRGHRFYTPDFKILNNDGSVEYHEVKGYMDQASRTKLDRMQRYYPEVKIVLIDQEAYKAIAKWKSLIPHWEVGHGSHRD